MAAGLLNPESSLRAHTDPLHLFSGFCQGTEPLEQGPAHLASRLSPGTTQRKQNNLPVKMALVTHNALRSHMPF
ncbi:hypothetical protein ABVT39_020213 [Epinephelus coioides]